jgi:Histidine kinase-, DNA gyrase B-, and HSP90-like ATPase
MSNVHIQRTVDNIRANTTIYTPIIETTVNAIQAIEASNIQNGSIIITVHRSGQKEIDDGPSQITKISISDNGIGFNTENRKSFDTLYSAHKINSGGKGFGRFISLKYFENVHIDSIYLDSDLAYKNRTFSMGKDEEIIVNEVIKNTESHKTGTTLTLDGQKKDQLNKRLETIARNLVESLLPYFMTEGYVCPKITLMESNGSDIIILNDYLNSSKAVIKEISLNIKDFVLIGNSEEFKFNIRIFKLFAPKNSISKISLVADKREVTESAIYSYVPEFYEEFYEKGLDGETSKNYIIKTYVFGKYLNDHVSLERGEFNFHKENDVVFGISKNQIEEKAAELTKLAVLEEVSSRQEKKKIQIDSYVEDEAPWHKAIYKTIDITNFPMNASKIEIETLLQKEKYRIEIQIKTEVSKLLADVTTDDISQNVSTLASKIIESSRNDLTHYIAMRRIVLDLFKKSLEIKEDGKYHSETTVHDIIFPTKKDSINTSYEDHNLWIIDERLNFCSYLSSELPLNGGRTQRTDIIAFNKPVAFRGENDSSNPVTIFEFKKPGRDDFANPSSKEDPIQQIIRYVNSIRDGEYKTPEGRKINVAVTTQFYGYVICELTPKVEKWLERDKNFTSMPDRKGWFQWFGNINLYIEVLSWDKLLHDADMRNKVFFHKLGI